MNRLGLVVVVAAATLGVAAVPALAKGEGPPIVATAVITGPGLKAPIEMSGDLFPFGEGPAPAEASLAEGLIAPSGLAGAGPEIGWYELAPDPSTLGPGYDVTYYFSNTGPFGTMPPIHQVIYPYVPDRPFVYTILGQRFLGSRIGEWWSAPATLTTWLVAHGLPASAPPVPKAPAQPRALPEVPTAEGFPWAVGFAATGLMVMLVMAALAGRRSQLARRA